MLQLRTLLKKVGFKVVKFASGLQGASVRIFIYHVADRIVLPLSLTLIPGMVNFRDPVVQLKDYCADTFRI